jgi:apolipoprotein N-acyltransferase
MAERGVGGRLFGRDPARTVLKLIVASIFVGGVLALLGLSPIGFWRGIFNGLRDLISAIGNSFGEVVVNLATYLVLGAAIVVPIWLISRLLSGPRNRD